MKNAHSPNMSEPNHSWSGVFAMALTAFALVASEFMPVSLLTPIATDLQVSQGQAGQGISLSGIFALITSLIIPMISARVRRKPLLIVLTLLMVVSGTLVALAPTYSLFMVGRALIGIAIGGFWSLSAATAMRLVPVHQVPRALAIVNGGNAFATVIAAPLGSYLGSLIGWRGAFFCIVPVALISALWLMKSLPAISQQTRTINRNVFSLLSRPHIAWGMVAVSVFFMGQFMLFTYLRPFLETETRVSSIGLSLSLLVLGVAGLFGTFVIEFFLRNGLNRTLIIIPLFMAFLALMLVSFGHSSKITVLLLGFWGLVATAAPVGWWTWLAQSLPDEAEAGGGLMVAIIQLAIALGATVGGVVFDVYGAPVTFELSAVTLVAAGALAFVSSRRANVLANFAVDR